MERTRRRHVADSILVWQRIPVAGSCLCFIALLVPKGSATILLLFPITALLACVEKLASVANTVAVERDWVRYLVITEITCLFPC